MEFKELAQRVCKAITDDGRVTMGETAILMRMVRPFAEQGDAHAVELEKLLRAVRDDGVVTPEESNALCTHLNALIDA